MTDSFSYEPGAGRIMVKAKAKVRSTTVPHPVFLRLKIHTTDPYWLIRLDEYANAKFPRNFRMTGTELFFQKGTTKYNFSFSLAGDSSDPAVFEGLVSFLHKHACIYSPREQEEMKKEAVVVEKKWKNLKAWEKKKEIEVYCQTRSRQWGLTRDEAEQFRVSMLEYILDTGEVKSSRITLADGHIVDIAGIECRDKDDTEDDESRIRIKLTARRTNKTSTAPRVDPLIKSWADALKKIAVTRAAMK